MEQQSVIVVGAGIVGATTALALAERGHTVHVVDAAPRIAAGASHANGAQLSYSYTDSLASPALLGKIPGLLAMADPAFRYHPGLDLDHLRWVASFLRRCNRRDADRATLAILELALRSRRQMHAWIGRYGFEFSHRAAAKMHLYRTERELAVAAARVALKNELGVGQRILGREEAMDLEPSLRECRVPIAGAVFSPLDEVGDPLAFAEAAIGQALRSGGGRLMLDTRVHGFLRRRTKVAGIRTDKGDLDADAVVVAAGAGSAGLIREIEPPPLIAPMAGYSLTFDATEFSPKVSLTDVTAKTVLCRLGDKVRVAGFADLGSTGGVSEEKRVAVFRNLLTTRFPKAAAYDSSDGNPWMGIRPMAPDSRPVVRRTRVSNVILNCGQGMLGWTLAAGCALGVVSVLEAYRESRHQFTALAIDRSRPRSEIPEYS